jgi:formylglycine-generating enzyme required for sulfatase activity
MFHVSEVTAMTKNMESGLRVPVQRAVLAVLLLAAACAPGPVPIAPVPVMDAEFVLIKPGTFQMGEVGKSNDHLVTLTHAFLMQKTEVTQAEWVAVMGSNPSEFRECGSTCPVENVSFENVETFIARLNERSPDKHYRLPTEAEWEYSARSGAEEELFPDAWTRETSGGTTHPVGRRYPNEWGLYDMEGNVSEWVNDWNEPYAAGPVTDPRGPASGERRSYRGGSWNTPAEFSRAVWRYSGVPTDHGAGRGFRLARTLQDAARRLPAPVTPP